jgi:hypothetical protein
MDDYTSSHSESDSDSEYKIQESIKKNHLLSDSSDSDSSTTSKSETPNIINETQIYVDSCILNDVFENINFYAYSWEENSFNIGINEKNTYYAKYTIYFDQESLLNNYDKSFKYILVLKPLFTTGYTKKENGRYETEQIFVKDKISIADFVNKNINNNLKLNQKMENLIINYNA